MFAKTIIDSDAFLDMPLSAQALYFHLSMRADDDGFINNPRKIQRMTGAGDDDFKLLLAKHFLLIFESGVVVIKHWRIHNYIRNDRYKPTVYQSEMSMLSEKENKSYTLGIPNGDQMETQVRLGKDRLGKDSIEGERKGKRSVPPTLEEVKAYCLERNNTVDAEKFFDYYETNGWVQGKGKPVKDWKACVRTWERSGFNQTLGNKNQKETYTEHGAYW